MISPTGRNNGFTLVEIVLCVVIIAVVMAMAAPSFKGSFQKIELNQSADDLMALLRWGQSQAVLSHQTYVLSLDPTEGSYQMLKEVESPEGTVVQEPLTHPRLSKRHTMPKTVTLSSDITQIHLLPDGTIEPALVQLRTSFQTKRLSSQVYAGKMLMTDEVHDEP